MAVLSAVPEFPAVPAGLPWLAGRARTVCASAVFPVPERALERGTGRAFPILRTGLAGGPDRKSACKRLRAGDPPRRGRLHPINDIDTNDRLPPAADRPRAAMSAAAMPAGQIFEGEKVNVTRQPFELRRLVAGAVSTLAEETPRPGCGIASVIAADVPERLCGDAGLLRQIIERLAGPSLGEGNGVCIRVSAADGRLRLAFETPWPRDGRPAARPGDGALAAVRPAVEAMQGRLAVLKSNGAASVRVEIPAAAAGETADQDAARGAAGARPSPGTPGGTA